MMAGLLLSPNGWSALEQSSNVLRTVVASVPNVSVRYYVVPCCAGRGTRWARVCLQDLRFVLGPVLQHAFHVRSLRVRLDTVLR